jgi:peptidoglycan hydrolase CwlO-like protein
MIIKFSLYDHATISNNTTILSKLLQESNRYVIPNNKEILFIPPLYSYATYEKLSGYVAKLEFDYSITATENVKISLATTIANAAEDAIKPFQQKIDEQQNIIQELSRKNQSLQDKIKNYQNSIKELENDKTNILTLFSKFPFLPL